MNTNTLNEFIQKAKTAVQEYLGEDFSVEVSTFRKNNGVSYQGMTIMEKGHNASPAICMEALYEMYREDENMGDVLKQIMDTYEKRKPAGSIDMEFLMDYEQVKGRVLFKLIGYERNREFLKNAPHIRFLDMAVVFYCMMFHETMGNVTILIRSTESGRWKVSAEELYECALENTPKILAERIRDIEEVLGMTETDSGEEIGRRMFVLTNTLQTFGAACMMYPDALRKFADQWDADFFILPSSVHEVLLLPDHGEYDLQEFKGMVYEINRTQLEPEEILTDSVYYYDRTEGKIRLL